MCECLSKEELALFIKNLSPFKAFPPGIEHIVAGYVDFDFLFFGVDQENVLILAANTDSRQQDYFPMSSLPHSLDNCPRRMKILSTFCPHLGRIIFKWGGCDCFSTRIEHMMIKYFYLPSRQWIDIKSMTLSRYGSAVVVHCGRIYAIGGCEWKCKEEEIENLSSIEILARLPLLCGDKKTTKKTTKTKTKTKQEGELASMSKCRYGCVATSCGQKIFVWEWGNDHTGECYDSLKNVWHPVADLPKPLNRGGSIFTVSADAILAIFGDLELNSKPFIYSVTNNEWIAAAWTLPFGENVSYTVCIDNPVGFITFVVNVKALETYTPWLLPVHLVLSQDVDEVNRGWIRCSSHDKYIRV